MIKASQWFAPKWKHADIEVRAAAVTSAADPALLQALADIARSDEAAAVRLAALQRSAEIELLRSCLSSERDDHNRQWLLTRLVKHHCQQSTADQTSLAQLTALLATLTAEQQLASWANSQIEILAKDAKASAVRQQAQQHISKQGLLGDLYSHEPDAELRAQMLARIDQPSTLERISKTLRKSNKALYQACQQRLAQLDSSQQQTASHQLGAAEDLLSDIEYLLHGKQAPLAAISGQSSLADTLQQAESRWQALAIDSSSAAGKALQQRWHNAMQILQQAANAKPVQQVSAPTAEAESAAPHDTADDQTAPLEAHAALQQLATELDALLARKHKQLHNLQQSLQPWRERWRAQWQQLETISRADQRLQDQLINRIQSIVERLDDRQQQHQQSHTALQQLLQQALAQALDGKLHAANSSEAELTQALAECPPAAQKAFQQQHADALRQLQTQLGELRQWQRWSDNQQRTRLLSDLRAAKDSDLNADALVNLVRDARQQWQQLEASEVQAGMRPLGQQHAQNRQFQGVCGMLMRTAKPFLDKRDVLRNERGKLIEERLQACMQCLSGTDVSRKQLLQHKRIISDSFQEIGAVAGDQRKSLLAALRQAQQSLQERLQTLSAAAEQDKRRLIRQAEQLPQESDQAAALQQAKNLQRTWQQLDVLPRKLEQQLWESFRAPMDQLFAAQDEQRQQHQAAQQEQREQQQNIVAELEALLQKPDSELADCKVRSADLQHQFAAHPRPDRSLQQRLRQAADQFDQRLQLALQQQRQQAREAVQSKSLEQQSAASQRLQALLANDSDSAVNAVADTLPSHLQQLDAEQLAQHLRQQSEVARGLCIAAEFMAGLPSPKQDQQLRMQYQVDRLSQHLRDRQQNSPAQQLRQLWENWYACVPMHPDHYQQLQARFEHAMTAADKVLSH